MGATDGKAGLRNFRDTPMKKLVLGIMIFMTGFSYAHPGHTVVYTADQLDLRSESGCPYCVFKVNEAEREARKHK